MYFLFKALVLIKRLDDWFMHLFPVGEEDADGFHEVAEE
jgi:hypothetical protein